MNLSTEVRPGKRILTRTEEWNICFDYVVGFPIKEISERYNISRSGVHRVITRHGIQTERGKRSKR